MTDTSGHHIVYGMLRDYLTNEELPDTDDERIRQQLARHLVKDLGYSKKEIEPRLIIPSCFNGNKVQSLVEFTIRIEGKRLFLLRYGPGSLVTREKAAVAAARILDPDYRIPLAIVTNGRDAELIETKQGKVVQQGMHCIPHRWEAARLRHDLVFEPYNNQEKREQALRILNMFDTDVCCSGSIC